MSFKRMGMGSAKPMFCEYSDDGWPTQIDSMDAVEHECDYRDDIVGFSTPIANYIAAVDPISLLALIDERDSLAERVADLESQ